MAEDARTVEAIVLRSVPYGDSDAVVHLFARGLGKVGAFARGARKSQKRFGGGLEPFALLEADLATRRSADLLELRSARIVTPHLGLREDLSRLAHAGYATELARELLRDHEPNDGLFDLLLSFFELLSQAGPRSLTLRALELATLDATGLAPVLEACGSCGRPLSFDARFDPSVGGAACPSCAGPTALPLDAATARLLGALREGGLAGAAQARDEGLPLETVRRALRSFIDHHVRHDLKSLQFLRDVGAPR